MPTLTNEQLVVARPALERLAQHVMPVAGALRIRQVLRAVRARLEDVEAERLKHLNLHARQDEHGKMVTVGEPPTARVVFASAADEVAFDAIHKELMAATWEHPWGVRVSDLPKEIAPVILADLGNLLEDDAVKEQP